MIDNDTVYSFSAAGTIKAWSIPDQTTKYEIKQDAEVFDFVVGQQGSPLEKLLVTANLDWTCRISNIKNGEEVATITLDAGCRALTVDPQQFVIIVGTDDKKVTFIDTTTFEIVKQVTLDNPIISLAFNQQNDTLLAVSQTGQVYSFKF